MKCNQITAIILLLRRKSSPFHKIHIYKDLASDSWNRSRLLKLFTPTANYEFTWKWLSRQQDLHCAIRVASWSLLPSLLYIWGRRWLARKGCDKLAVMLTFLVITFFVSLPLNISLCHIFFRFIRLPSAASYCCDDEDALVTRISGS